MIVYGSWGDQVCWYCRHGEPQLCPQATEPGWQLDGGGNIVWGVQTMALEQANAALDRLRRGDVAGRLVLTP